MNNRLLGADFIRAAACLMVLFHHLSQRMSFRHDMGFTEWFRVFERVGTFGVAVFFVLSGYLLSRPFWQAIDAGERMPSLRVYLMRRAARILPGYWLALLLTLVLSVTVFTSTLDGQLMLRATAGMLLISDWHWLTLFPVDVNGPLWSISFEVTSYLLLIAGMWLMFSVAAGSGWLTVRVAWLGVIAIALVAHLLFVTYFPIDEVNRGWQYGRIGGAKSWMPRYNPFGFFAIFAIGTLAGGAQVLLAKQRSVWFDALAVAAFASTLVAAGQHLGPGTSDGWGWLGVPYGFPWFPLSVAAMLATMPSTVAVGLALENPLARYLARISFGIYIYHFLVLELFAKWVPEMGRGRMDDPARFTVFSISVIAIVVIVAHLSFRYIEQPVIQWARSMEDRLKVKRNPDLRGGVDGLARLAYLLRRDRGSSDGLPR